MRLVTSCVRLACDVELLSNNREPGSLDQGELQKHRGLSPVGKPGDGERHVRVLKSLVESAWIYPSDHS